MRSDAFGVIASGAKQSSAREARQKKRGISSNLGAYFARLPARGWIASLRSQ
jgi:hypothetical protein